MSTTTSQKSGRVLSIQSHVAFGYVGGKAAVFPLQCLGYDVDVIHTVNFSNHVGYGQFGGTRISASELNSLFSNMRQNQLLSPSRLLTGYTAGADALQAVANLAKEIKSENPNLIYILDPVLGDAGRLYVSPETIPVYRSMLPLSTAITPNWFEVETLTDVKLNDLESLRRALKILHQDYNVPNVVISSIPLQPWLADALPDKLKLANERLVHAQCVPLISGYFSGVGDLFSALFLAHFDHAVIPSVKETPASHAASFALAKTHAILRLTEKHASLLPADEQYPTDDELDRKDPLRKAKRMRGRELRLVQGQDIIRQLSLQPDSTPPLATWSNFW